MDNNPTDKAPDAAREEALALAIAGEWETLRDQYSKTVISALTRPAVAPDMYTGYSGSPYEGAMTTDDPEEAEEWRKQGIKVRAWYAVPPATDDTELLERVKVALTAAQAMLPHYGKLNDMAHDQISNALTDINKRLGRV